MSGDPLVRRAETAECVHRAEHSEYEFIKRIIVGKGESGNFDISLYEIPPGKSAYPYHYHLQNEEVFYILSGTGLLRLPKETRTVTAGDYLYFPKGEKGAHKLTNASRTESLIYADFDIRHSPEVAIYPDSGKVGVFSEEAGSWIFPVSSEVEYYEGE